MLTLTCSSYGETIPVEYASRTVQGGKNTSPGFRWTDPPTGTKSFALSIVDPHPVARNWVHWLLIDIPFSVREIAEGASRTDRLPKGCRELFNTDREPGYTGPAPPRGSGPHPYVATLYALNTERLVLDRKASLREFLAAVDGKTVEELSVTGFYERT